jgi:hypothetical protein
MWCVAKNLFLYQHLKDRADAEERRGVAEHRWFVDDQNAWQNYINDRGAILAMLRRDVLDEAVLSEHLDLKLPGDLASPLVNEPDRFGSCRHPEWRERATRLESALRWWDSMSPEERQVLRSQRVMRKLEAAKPERQHG